jgi:addiction module RelB/DinJ family antitoxin
MAAVQVAARIDKTVLDKAGKVFAFYGLDVPSAIRMFITTTANEGKYPIPMDRPPDSFNAPGGQKAETDQRGGTELSDDEMRAMGLTPDPTLEECLADAERLRQLRISDPEHYSFKLCCHRNPGDTRSHEQIIADAVAEQREARDEWDD